jgi:short-subunit dehydrogenase
MIKSFFGNKNMKVGIVTGASSGIGREFACQIQNAYDLDEIWLIARREELLNGLSEELDGVKGVPLALDLRDSTHIRQLEKKLEDERPDIVCLVNSAGRGRIGAFADEPPADHLDMIDLNIKAVVALTHFCLPYMGQGSVIFQIASINAFMPLPDGAVYAATKAFVLNFSHALHQESLSKGVHVITVSPGPVATDFLKAASRGETTASESAAPTSEVVRQAIKDAASGKLNSSYGFASKMNIFLSRLLGRKLLLKLSSGKG